MSLSVGQNNFISTYYPYADYASQKTGIPILTILAQWLDETGAGTSSVGKAFTQGYNLAGIKAYGNQATVPGTPYAAYNSPNDAVNAWIQNINSDIYKKYNIPSTNPISSANALAESPWSGSNYGITNGVNNLISVMQNIANSKAYLSKGNIVDTGISTGGLLGSSTINSASPTGSLNNSTAAGSTATGNTGTLSPILAPFVPVLILIVVVAVIGLGIYSLTKVLDFKEGGETKDGS